MSTSGQNTVKQLSVVTGVLFFISVFVFYNEHKRGTDFVRGAEFVSGLNVDKVHKFEVESDGKKVTFLREGNSFSIENHNGYPASSEKVNDLMLKLSGITVKDKATSSKSDHPELEVAPDQFKSRLAFFDKNGKKSFELFIGKSTNQGGSHMRQGDQDEVYVSEAGIHLSFDVKSYIDQVLVKLEKKKIDKIVVSHRSDRPLTLKRGDDDQFQIESVKNPDKYDLTKVESMVSSVLQPRFNEFHLFSDPKVSSVSFDDGELDIQLSNKLIYRFKFARADKKYFLKPTALLTEVPNEVTIARDADKETLQGVEDMLKAKGVADQFNVKHGKWVYEISEYNFNNWNKKLQDLAKK